MDTRHLLARAADTELTYPERAAALSAAARSSLPDDTWPAPPPGHAWRDGRVVLCNSIIPPLQVQACQPDEMAPEVPVAAEPVEQPIATAPKADEPERTKTVRPPKPGSSAARIIELLRRPQGVSVEEAVAELGCKPISIKALISINSRRVGGRALFEEGRYRMR
ncbi:hypothetical protein GRZ55_10885 [Chelativorans sp. ZYF759]|uniref:hypothetical protein n=1 Tax=Chelativorans sp. ZYF759 TaxID=2692213 RepID=UPI00145E64BE|nr:hypothetical protein [Chelativorans sp. ZYF759]NMG39747.1 hypothetical protein [Chelativorans sp. ZYF759]